VGTGGLLGHLEGKAGLVAEINNERQRLDNAVRHDRRVRVDAEPGLAEVGRNGRPALILSETFEKVGRAHVDANFRLRHDLLELRLKRGLDREPLPKRVPHRQGKRLNALHDRQFRRKLVVEREQRATAKID